MEAVQYSDQKPLLRATQLACLLGLGAAAFMLYVNRSGQPMDTRAWYVQAFMFSAAAWSSLTAGALATEFARVKRFGTSDTSREAELEAGEYASLTKWCVVPAGPIQVCGIALVAYALVVLEFGLGPQPVGDDETIERLARSLESVAAMLLAYPVLASAAKMNGTYAEHFHPRLRRQA